jgi:prepilin-type N-terminal cleavage/methylation domain-containing protein
MPVGVNTNRLSPANIFLLLRCYKYTMKNYKLALGFTLIELLIVVSIVAILVTVAAPSFVQQMDDSKAYGVRDKLANTFAYARSEAVGRQENVTVSASSDGVNDGVAGDWVSWWLVRDAARNLLKVVDVSGFLVAIALNGPPPALAPVVFNSVCFNAFGVECNRNFASVDFVITPPGAGLRPSILRLTRGGAVSYQ